MEKSKTTLSLFIFLFINFAFAVKYSSVITVHYLLVAVGATGFYILLWRFRDVIGRLALRVKYLNALLLLGYLVFFAFVFIKIPPESLNVDRWSIITAFWDNYFSGKYVYFAQSFAGNYPGPMPFYFILALPFYLVGELGYFSILGIVIFIPLMRYNLKPHAVTTFYMILTMTSIFYLWEVTCRSNILLNAMLVLFSITYFLKGLERKSRYFLLWNGIIIGLLLSTRNVFVIPYFIAGLFALKQKMISIKEALSLGAVSVGVFCLTFVPFIVGHLDDFGQMNPFLIQSGFLMPVTYTGFCVLLSFGTFFVVREKSDVYFYSGLILFLAIVLHYGYKLTLHAFTQTFFEAKADISYFILCIPFVLFYLVEKKEITKFG